MDLKERFFYVKDVSRTLIVFGVLILAGSYRYNGENWIYFLGGLVILIGAAGMFIKNKWMRLIGGLTISIAGIAIGFSVFTFYSKLLGAIGTALILILMIIVVIAGLRVMYYSLKEETSDLAKPVKS